MPSRFVLVVDTSPVSWQRIGRALSGSPCFAMSARSAGDAEVAARAGQLAVVVASMRLPDATGYELARRLREIQPGLIVALLVDGRDAYDPAQGAAAGVWGSLEWPCAADRLRRALDAALEAALSAPQGAEPPTDLSPSPSAVARMNREVEELSPVSVKAIPLGEPPVSTSPMASGAPYEIPGDALEAMPAEALEAMPAELGEAAPAAPSVARFSPAEEDMLHTEDGLVPPVSDEEPLPTSRLTPLDPLPPIEDERVASFLPRDWRAYPPVRVDPAAVSPAIERAILEVLPEVVDVVLRRALATSPILRELIEVAVDEAVRAQMGPIARRVIEERLAEIEAAAEDGA